MKDDSLLKDVLKLGVNGDISEIMPGVYVSRYRACRSKEFLQKLGITHIVNCSSSACKSMFPETFKYLNLDLKDEPINSVDLSVPATSIQPYIPSASLFIQEALDHGGKVVCHCRKGISRSVSIIAGYLMFEKGSTLTQAFTLIREKRSNADPNVWFVEDLKQFQHNLDLRRIERLKHTLFASNDEKPKALEDGESS